MTGTKMKRIVLETIAEELHEIELDLCGRELPSFFPGLARDRSSEASAKRLEGIARRIREVEAADWDYEAGCYNAETAAETAQQGVL